MTAPTTTPAAPAAPTTNKHTSTRISPERVTALLLVAGVFLRLGYYLTNKPLWFDEYQLMRNIVERSFSGLLAPLDYEQGAPVGFLFIEKAVTLLFGTGEYSLRLFPLAAGIASLFLFVALARHILRPGALPIATALFALHYPLIYYAAEVKQYSSDVAAALLILLGAVHLARGAMPLPRVVAFACAGALLVWLSHPAIFVLAGTTAALGIAALHRQAWHAMRDLVIIGGAFSLSFIAFYLVSLRALGTNDYLLNFWSEGFAPFPPTSLADLGWFPSTALAVIIYPVGFPVFTLGAAALVVGGIALHNQRQPLALLLMPVLVTLLAALAHVYPFGERLILFLVPIFFLFIAEGLASIGEKLAKTSPLERLLPLLLTFLFWIFPFAYMLRGETLFAICSRAEGLPLSSTLALGFVALATAPRSQRGPRLGGRLAVLALVPVLLFEGAAFARELEDHFVMPDWRRIAHAIEQQSAPGEPVVAAVYDALPMQRYLNEAHPFMTLEDEQKTASLETGSTDYLLIASRRAAPLLLPEQVEQIIFDSALYNVQVARTSHPLRAVREKAQEKETTSERNTP